jgi:hypothetical protein
VDAAGRNDPCPCGSGKKYKKCCLAADAERRDEAVVKAPSDPFGVATHTLRILPGKYDDVLDRIADMQSVGDPESLDGVPVFPVFRGSGAAATQVAQLVLGPRTVVIRADSKTTLGDLLRRLEKSCSRCLY